MLDSCKKDADLSSTQSMRPRIADCASWWASTASQIQQSSLTENLSLKMVSPNQYGHNAKQMRFQFQDQDSSSTQSTGQSYHEVASVGESNPCGKALTSMSSGYNETLGRPEAGQIKSTLLMGSQDCVMSPSQVDYRPSFACIPLSYTDPYYSGLLAGYGEQAMIPHPQMMGMAPARVPLPLDLPQDEPIYVNAKQYHAILRRREYRAKLEAQSKLSKVRKPYLHESRHLHALKRARGSGGRFLNKKKLEECKPSTPTNGRDESGTTHLHLTSNLSDSEAQLAENCKEGASTISCSDITRPSISENIIRQQELRFSVYPGTVRGGTTQCGNQRRYLSVHH